MSRIKLLMVTAVALFVACGEQSAGGDQPAAMSAMGIEAAQQRLTDSLINLPGVSGVALGECDGQPCIKVMIAKRTKELTDKIPETFEGYLVEIQETGEIQPLGQRDK